MKKPTALLVAAGLLLGLLGADGVQAASSSAKRHHTRLHHRRTTAHKHMSISVRRHRAAATTRVTARRVTNGHGPTIHRRGRGVYGGVFSEPTVTNNGQAAPGASQTR